MNILQLKQEHLAQVAALETLCFPAEPWSEQALLVLCRDHGIGFVATNENGDVLAYVGMTYAADEGSITNVATHPDARRLGLGRAVVSALLQEAVRLGLAFVYLEVRPSNAPAIALYESFGFVCTGRRKNFYRYPTEDALVMCISLEDVTSQQ